MNLAMQLALGGLRKRGGWTGEIISESSFIVAREQSITVNENARIDLQIHAHKTTGVEPCGIWFDLLVDSKFYGISNPKAQCSFWTTFGDTGAEFQSVSNEFDVQNANKAQGFYIGHVYADVGEYTAVSMCKDHISGKIGYAVKTITVTSADVKYAGKTVYFDPSGVFEDAPAGSINHTDYASALSAFNGMGAINKKRFLIARGSETVVTSPIYADTGDHIAPRGTGADPKLLWPANGFPSGYSAFYVLSTAGINDITVWGIEFVGDYDSETGTGESWDVEGVYALRGDDVTVFRCKATGLNTLITVTIPPASLEANYWLIHDNEATNWYNYGVFAGLHYSDLAGNNFQQKATAVKSSDGAKSTTGYRIDVVDTSLTYNMPSLYIYGDSANAVMFDYDTVNETYTEIVNGVDGTFNVGSDPTTGDNGTHSFTLNSALNDDGNHEFYYYTRRWADHGPIRLNTAAKVGLRQMILKSLTGWTASVQPCIRFNTNGQADGEGNLNQLYMTGGWQVMSFEPQNESTSQPVTPYTLMESCVINGLEGTTCFIKSRTGNLILRNIAGIMPDVPAENESFGTLLEFVKFFRESVDDASILNSQIEVHNFTMINLQSTANGGAVDDVVVNNASGFTNINSSNHLHVHADRPTALPDYSPLDASNYYRPQSGSAALDAGVKNDYVWDDLAGNLVGETASLGAFDSQADYRVNFSTESDNYATVTSFNVTPSADSYLALNFNSAIAFGSIEYLASQSPSSLGSYIQLSTNRLRVRLSGRILDITIPDAAATYGDGADHEMILNLPLGGVMSVTIDGDEYTEDSAYTLTASDILVVGAIASSSSANSFNGQVWDLDMKNATDRTKYAMTTGSITTEPAVIGTGTMTYVNTDEDDIT